MATSPRTHQPQAAQPAAPPATPKTEATPVASEIMLSIARSTDGRWRVVIGSREHGREADLLTKGWTRRSGALADLARAIPKLQQFLIKGQRRTAADGVEART